MTEYDPVRTPEDMTTSAFSAFGSRNAHEFIRYFGASLLALAVDAGSLALMTSVLGIPYLISGALSFSLGLIVIYVLSIMWVFEKRDMHNPVNEFIIFAIVGIVGLGINELVLWFLTGYFGFFYLVSKVASVIIVFTWNFFARKALLFR